MAALKKPDRVALTPEHIPFVKPRLKVQIGDRVKIGTPLIEDKRNPNIKFLSPGGGEVTRIHFGPRRIISEIVITLEQNEAHEPLRSLGDDQIETISRPALVDALMAGGVWPFLKGLPFRDIADPEMIPPFIMVRLDAAEPFQPSPEAYLSGELDLFEFGLKILRRLSKNVFIITSKGSSVPATQLKNSLTHVVDGVYPADDPGVVLYHIKTSPDENRAWYVDGQDVLLLARLLKTGRYPVERIVVLGGYPVTEKKHFLTRAGIPLDFLTRQRIDETIATRYIVGGTFTGYTGTRDTYMGFYEKSLILLPEGAEKEFFGFARPGFEKPSRSRAFLSVFNKSALPMDCNCHGEERACVNCGYCATVCPVDIFPQFTYKSILADEIDEALAHGLLDCVECGLCTYVCPSKVELSDTLKKTRKAYYLEQI